MLNNIMLRGRVPVGHPWALGTVKGGGRRCTIDKSSWLYTQNGNNFSDLYGITWSVPNGTTVPKCRELIEPDAHVIRGQVVLDANWIDVAVGMSDMFVKKATICDLQNSTRCVTTASEVPFVTEFVYPNTLIKKFGGGMVFYETITPLEYEKTLLTWCVKHEMDPNLDAQVVTLVESFKNRDTPNDPFQERILERLGDLVVDDFENTFVLL